MNNITEGIAGEDYTYKEDDKLVIVRLNTNKLKTEL